MSVRLGLLALLGDRPMHGYQLRQEFEARTGGTWPLNIGQVYTTLARLVRDGLVEAASQGEVASHQPSANRGDAPAGSAGSDAALSEHAEAADSTTAGDQYHLTPKGHDAIAAWWATPVPRGAPARDELAIKLALAVTVPGVDVVQIVQHQRTETMRGLRDYTRLKISAETSLRARPAAVNALDAAGGAQHGSADVNVQDAGPAGGGAGGNSPNANLAWSLVLDNLVFATEAEMRWLDHVEARLARAAAMRRPLGAGAATLASERPTTAAGVSTESEVR